MMCSRRVACTSMSRCVSSDSNPSRPLAKATRLAVRQARRTIGMAIFVRKPNLFRNLMTRLRTIRALCPKALSKVQKRR
ncbi:hypothetical protein LDDCCGHA_2973 [Methylobacterium oxalidis]|nr:hypothetical protein LDDCCGHA_2973 [Methylobacterium oxalidis]